MQQQGYGAPRNSYEETVIDPTFPPPSLIKTAHKMAENSGKDMEKRKKKEKKWSLGGLFRRRKNKDTTSDTESSSPSDNEAVKKGFLERRRSARKKRNRGSKDVTGSFEHVIIKRQNNDETAVNSGGSSNHMLGVPSREVSSDRAASRSSHESLNKKQNHHQHRGEPAFIRGSSVSLEGTSRRSGRQQIKARVEATRDRLCADSSSDEGNSSRHSTSSVQRFRSDESLSGVKDGSLSRKSRGARTERYIKRLSRDEEAFKEFNLDASAPRISRSDEKLTTNSNSTKKNDLKVPTGNRWTAKVVYQESSDYDTKYTAKTKSTTPSPIQSPKIRPKNLLHVTNSAPGAIQNYSTTFPPSHTQQQREGFVSVSTQDFSSANRSNGINKFPQKQQQVFSSPPRLPRSGNNIVETVPPPTRLYHNNADNTVFHQKKSASYDSSINHSHVFNNSKPIMHTDPSDSNVLVVQFPIGRSTAIGRKDILKDNAGVQSRPLLKQQQNPPPPPPPRDPQRKVFPNHVNGGSEAPAMSRPMSYAFENRTKPRMNKSATDYNSNNVNMINYNSNGGRQYLQDGHAVAVSPSIKQHHRSNSDHQLMQSSSSFSHHYLTENSQSQQRHAPSVQRSPSVDVALANRIPRHYQYYTDQQPRSRKPIQTSIPNQRASISGSISDQPYLSDSQMVIKPPYQQVTRVRPVQHATEFWKQKEQESGMKVHLSDGSPKLIQKHFLQPTTATNQERSQTASPRHHHDISGYSRPRLPPLVIPTARTDSTSSDLSASPRVAGQRFRIVHNEIGIPVFDGDEPAVADGQNKDGQRPLSMVLEKSESGEHQDALKKEKTPPAPPQRRYSKTGGSLSESEPKTASNSNLEEALSELEAIYKSLRLGEEALHEKRDLSADSNRYDPSNWSAWVQSRGFESDSSFNYSRSSSMDSSSVDSPLRRHVTAGCRKSIVPDRVADDMAYRRLNKKDRAPSLEQNVISQAGSFLLVSPTLSPPPIVESPPPPPQEPDVTLDDVVYRNIKHVNNTLKITDPQPPFGIPLGPITPAPNSDYLHVIPKERYRSTFKPRKTPDVITDDLAFRNLRKDETKTVPMFASEDGTDSTSLRRKRAVRSLSANLLSIIQKEAYSKYFNNSSSSSSSSSSNSNNKSISNNLINGGGGSSDLEKSQSFTDLPDALAIAHRVLDEKENLVMAGSNLLRVKNKCKRSMSTDDPDATPRASRCSDVSSMGIGTSTETLTDSRVNLRSHDETTSYGRLSATPEKRTSAGDGHTRNRHSFTPEKINDASRSYGVARHSRNYSETTDGINLTQSDNESLDFLVREARATSEQIGRELKQLSSLEKHDKKKLEKSLSDSNNNTNNSANNKEVPQSSSSHGNSPSKTGLSIGKVVHHKPVRLNTFSITDDNVLENTTIISSKPIEDIEGSNSKSMTDLLKELTRCLDSDFGGGGATTDDNNTNKSTSPSICSRLSILDDDDNSKQQRTCDPSIVISNNTNNDKQSSPNISKRTTSEDSGKRSAADCDDYDSDTKYVNKIRETASSLSKLSETGADCDDDSKEIVKSSSIKLSLNLGSLFSSSPSSDIKQHSVESNNKQDEKISRLHSDVKKGEDVKSEISSERRIEKEEDNDDEKRKNEDHYNGDIKRDNSDKSSSSNSSTTPSHRPSSASKHSERGDNNEEEKSSVDETPATWAV